MLYWIYFGQSNLAFINYPIWNVFSLKFLFTDDDEFWYLSYNK